MICIRAKLLSTFLRIESTDNVKFFHHNFDKKWEMCDSVSAQLSVQGYHAARGMINPQP